MKNFFLIYVLLVFATGCSDKYKSIADAAPVPTLTFLNDTLFIREKDPTNINATGKGMLYMSCTPAGHQFNLSFSDTSGKVHFSYRGQLLQDSKPFPVADDVNSLYCYADAPGIYAVDFYLTDQLGKTATRKLIVKCARGQKPVASLSFGQTGDETDHGNWMYYFDASGSTQPFGSIVSYHYLINGTTIVVNRPLLKYNFHDVGQQQIDFFVLDDLGLSSDTLHYSIVTQ